MNLDSSPSHFHMHQISHDNDHELQYHHHPFVPNRSSSLSCHFFFDQTQDHAGFYDHRQLYQPSHHHIVDEKYSYRGGSSYEMKNKVDSGLKLTLWKKEERDELQSHDNNLMKWMSSKMRVMQKMKKTDNDHRVSLKTNDQKLQPSSSSAETELSSNSSSYNNNSPIRVCSDCNTTKTPLWRSGPKGPKSLCNACGIRQRKARRAMAAAAANGAAASTSDLPSATTKIKLQQKVKTTGKNGHASQLKKRCKTAAAASTSAAAEEEGKKQIGFEDFLINLSKNIAFHRVFPEEEKDAAILLMALSSGLVSG